MLIKLRVSLNGKNTTARLPLQSIGQTNFRYMDHCRTANSAEAGSKVYLNLFRYDASASGTVLFMVTG